MKPLLFCLLCATAFLFLGCTRVPLLVEYPDFEQHLPFEYIGRVPIILVGCVIADSTVASPHPSKWNDGLKVQLSRATVQVENVLQGDVGPGEISIYYFRYLLVSGPPRLNGWQKGARNVFFLRRDTGVFRTFCDGWARCVVPVFSGPHPGFYLKGPLEQQIVDLLLTRGQGTGDQEMVQAIFRSQADQFADGYTIQKLQRTAMNETPAVRQAACKKLSSFSAFAVKAADLGSAELSLACGSPTVK